MVYRRLLRYEEAVADFNRAIELKPDYAWAYAYRGVMCSIANRYAEAVVEFDRAIALDETIVSALFPKPPIGLSSGRTTASEIIYDTAIVTVVQGQIPQN